MKRASLLIVFILVSSLSVQTNDEPLVPYRAWQFHEMDVPYVQKTFLKTERGISFERIVVALQEGDLLDVLEHPNSEKYAGQRLYVLNIDN